MQGQMQGQGRAGLGAGAGVGTGKRGSELGVACPRALAPSHHARDAR